jgi:DNA polymerase-3 subunit epsilon
MTSCNNCINGKKYFCSNCGTDSVYDVLYNEAFCDRCELLNNYYTVNSQECTICDKKEIFNKKNILFFDTETTGLPKNWNAPITDTNNWPRLVQLAYIIYDDEGILLSKNDLIIFPEGYSIPPESSEIHGITDERAREIGKPIKSVLLDFLNVLKSSELIVGHNINFDINIVGCEFIRNGYANPFENLKKICTMESTTNYCAIDGPYGYKWPKLSELYFKLFDRHFTEAHDASVDIKATSECFWELVGRNLISTSTNNNAVKVEKPKLVPCFIKNEDERKYGFKFTGTNDIAIKCQFEFTHPFIGNIAKVLYSGKHVYIDLNGFIIQPIDNFYGSKDFEKGLVAAKASRQLNPLSTEKICGYVDIESLEIIKIPFEYNDAKEFVNGFASVKKGNFWGLIDSNGQVKLELVYEWLEAAEHGLLIAKKNGLWGLIDNEGNEVLPIIYETYLYYKNEPFHTVLKNGKYGFYDMRSNKFLGLIYDGASVFKDGCVAVEIDNKWGFLNKDLIEFISFEYEGASSFSEGLAPVKKQGRWGYINKQNELVIPCDFRTAGAFTNGKATVEYPLNWRKNLQIYFTGKYERVLHTINKNGESQSSWKHIMEDSKNRLK